MPQVLKSHSAAERIAAAVEFIRSFPPATELLIIGASRDAVDDFVRELARSVQATFGLHRFSLTQLAARLAVGRLAGAGIVRARQLVISKSHFRRRRISSQAALV